MTNGNQVTGISPYDENERIVQIFENGGWVNVHPRYLKEGVRFRMFEPTGEPVADKAGETVFVCVAEVYKNKEGIYTIEIVDNTLPL
jgi:hypothetical protein